MSSWRRAGRPARLCGWPCRARCGDGLAATRRARADTAAAEPRRSTRCRRGSGTTRISTARFITPPPWASYSARISRCCRTIAGCRWAITAAAHRSRSRASSLRARSGSGSAHRAQQPTLGRSERLDYELELGVFVGAGNALGARIAIDEAESHVFGLCLLNDWSARDLQAWEYQPLGPFLGKNFATTISPWIVTLEALEPYRCRGSREATATAALPGQRTSCAAAGAIDIQLEAWIETASMRAAGQAATRLSHSELPPRLLEHCADDHAPHHQRLQSAGR
jgi:hypothetical protein